jgi:hypothetical protein
VTNNRKESATVLTIEQAIATYGVNVDEHLDRQATIPVLAGLQFQGDVAIVPDQMCGGQLVEATTSVPRAGVAVVRGENGGNTHLLLGERCFFDPARVGDEDLELGVLTVPVGEVAYVAHPEHAYSGIAPGNYELRRQREQADVIRLVQD